VNRAYRWKRHWKLVASLIVVLVLLLTVFGNVAITIPE
jgi:hypothetical protein